MSAFLTLVAFDGHTLNDASYQTLVLLEDDLASTYASDTIEADRPLQFPTLVGIQPQSRTFTIKVTLLGSYSRAKFEAVERWFDPAFGERYLTADDDASVRRRLLCQPLTIKRVETTMLQVTLVAQTGIWEADTETYGSSTIAATDTAVSLTNAGNTKAPFGIALTPTSQMSNATSYITRRRMSFANRSELALNDAIGEGYPVDLGQDAFDTDALTTAKMQADGDDLQVYESGQLVPRWLDGIDTTTTKVWKNHRSGPMLRVTLAAAFASSSVPAAGTTFALSNPEGTAGWRQDEFMTIGTETVHVKVWSATEFVVVQRGALGSTAAAHSAGDYGYRDENPYLSILYNYSNAAAYDSTSIYEKKPVIDLSLSTNTKHVWAGPMLPPTGQRRSGAFLPEKSDDGATSDNIRLYDRAMAQFALASTQFLSVADNAALSVANVDFSFGGWFILDSKPATLMQLLGKMGAAGQYAYGVYWDNTTDRFIAQISNDGTALVSVTGSTFGAPALGQLVFVLIEHDSVGNTWKIQVNNGTADSQAHATGCFDNTAAFQIGAFNSGLPLDGKARSCFFTKKCFTAAEKTAMYNNGVPLDYSQLSGSLLTSLAAYWDLKPDSVGALDITDDSTGTNDLTNNNGVTLQWQTIFEDALPIAGRPAYNNATRDLPVPLDDAFAALEMDFAIGNNLRLHGYVTDTDGNESRLVNEEPQSAATNQQYNPLTVTQKLRLNGRIGLVTGYLPAVGSLAQGNLSNVGGAHAGARFVLTQTTYLTRIDMALIESSASTADIFLRIMTDSSDAPSTQIFSMTVLNAVLTSSMAVVPFVFATTIVLPAGTYWATLEKSSASGTIAMGYVANRVHENIYLRLASTTVLGDSPYLAVYTDRTASQADAALETTDKVVFDNVEVTLDSTRAPLIVMGSEETMYLFDNRIRNVRNWCTNGSFESNTTGWTPGGTNTQAVSVAEAHYDPRAGYYGRQSNKLTYSNNAVLNSYALTFPAAGTYMISAWVWVPTNFNTATAIEINRSSYAGDTLGTQVLADFNKRDQWQRITTVLTVAGGDLVGNIEIKYTGSAPTVGRFIYLDDLQIEPGSEAYAGGYFATDGDVGGDFIELFFPCALNQRVLIDTKTRQIIDEELGLPIPFALNASNPDKWLEAAPGVNILRYTEAGVTGLTLETAHRSAYL